jgi:transposase-like protein
VDTSFSAIMRQEVDRTKRKRRQFIPEFKADVVKLVRAGGRSIVQTARDLDLAETALRGGFGRLRLNLERGPSRGSDPGRARGIGPTASGEQAPADGARHPEKATAFFAKENE